MPPFVKGNGHRRFTTARRIVDEIRQFFGSHGARRRQAETEQDAIHNVGLARSVWARNSGESTPKGYDGFAVKGFKVVDFNMLDVQVGGSLR
jgi:hypothetical protein